MDRGDFLLGVATVVGSALLVVLVEFLRGQIERGQRRSDRRDEFTRQTLVDLQDALDELSRLSHEQHVVHQRNAKVTDELSRERVIVAGRVRRLSSRVEDAQVRADVQAVIRAFTEATRQAVVRSRDDKDYPFTSEYTLLSLEEPLGRLYDRIGELIRAR